MDVFQDSASCQNRGEGRAKVLSQTCLSVECKGGRGDCARAREHSSDILVLYLRTFQSKAKDFHLSSQPNLTSRQGIGYSHTQRKMKVCRNKTCLSPPSLPEYFTLKMGGGGFKKLTVSLGLDRPQLKAHLFYVICCKSSSFPLLQIGIWHGWAL